MMKTAVSIPDPLYLEAERIAKRLCLTRSALYARALERFIDESRSDHVTAALDEVYAGERKRDAFLDQAAAAVLKDEDW